MPLFFDLFFYDRLSKLFIYSYILKVPFDKVNNSGIVYVWIGSKSDEDEAKLAEEIANKLYDTVSMAHFACCNRCIIKN